MQPWDVFYKTFTDEVLNLSVNQTNKYAEIDMNSKLITKSTRVMLWPPTDRDEIKEVSLHSYVHYTEDSVNDTERWKKWQMSKLVILNICSFIYPETTHNLYWLLEIIKLLALNCIFLFIFTNSINETISFLTCLKITIFFRGTM